MKIILIYLILLLPFSSIAQGFRPRLDTTNNQKIIHFEKMDLPKYDYDLNEPWPACTGNISWPSDTSKSLRKLLITKRKGYAKRNKNVVCHKLE